jgi:lysozyme
MTIIVAISFLLFKMVDLTNSYEMTQSKVEKINTQLSLISTKISTKIPNGATKDEVNEEVNEDYFGIDVSHWNGDIISEIPANTDLSFIICKATQGTRIVDSEFKKNWSSIKQFDKIRGAYHFYIYKDDPIKQANHFCDVVNDLQKTDISLILDIEELSLPKNNVNNVKLKADVIKFLEQVEKRIQRTPILYTSYSFANQYLDDIVFSKYPLWLAEYSKGKPSIPHAWKKTGYKFHQKSNDYNINSTKEDYDVFHGKKEQIYE